MLARFSVLTQPASAFVFVSNLLKAPNRSSPLVMLLLIANVVYHPFQLLRAETDDAIACLPIEQFAIY
jgi:hypothetical protein